MFCVYKYVFNGNVIYVGKTNDINRRVTEHASGIGIEEKFLPYTDSDIYIHECGSETEMDFLEKLLIYYYKPPLNIIDSDSSKITFSIDLDWKPLDVFRKEHEDAVKHLRKNIHSNESRINNYIDTAAEIQKNVIRYYPFFNFLSSHREEIIQRYNEHIGIPENILPPADSFYIYDRYVKDIYESFSPGPDGLIWVKFSNEFLTPFFAHSWKKDWVEVSLGHIGEYQYDKIMKKVANLRRKNIALNEKISQLRYGGL